MSNDDRLFRVGATLLGLSPVALMAIAMFMM
jgi:hypothetical protein